MIENSGLNHNRKDFLVALLRLNAEFARLMKRKGPILWIEPYVAK